MASTRTSYPYTLIRHSAYLQTLSEHESIRSSQECLEELLKLMDASERDQLGPRLSRLLESRTLSDLSFSRLLRYATAIEHRQAIFRCWIDEPKVLESLLGVFNRPESNLDWLSSDPGLIEDIRSLIPGQVPRDIKSEWNDAKLELVQQLQESSDEFSSIEILKRFYRRWVLTAQLHFGRQECSSLEFRTSSTELAETILRNVCDRVCREPGFGEIQVAFIALGAFAERCLAPNLPWPVLGIYEEVKHEDRDMDRTTQFQTADRLLERIGDWIHRITDGTVALSWPMEIESIPLLSKRINAWRGWLDALPWHATAVHAPMLFTARYAAGSETLCSKFLQEARAFSLSPLRTEVDVEYLAGYFGAAVESYREACLGGGVSVASRRIQAIEAIVALRQVKRLEECLRSGGRTEEVSAVQANDDFTLRLEASLSHWIAPCPLDECQLQSEGLQCCESAKEWIRKTLGVPLWDSVLAESILTGKNLTSGSGLMCEGLKSKLAAFDSPEIAHGMLQELAHENISVLSSRNCRYHFSKIVDRLLDGIQRTPSPDLTLRNIVSIGRSLGGKGVLWELFSSHSLLMELYTRLCGTSPYLVQILLSNPGMIDDLLDSLMLERVPDYAGFKSALDTLCKGAAGVEPVVLAFRNAMHLAIGVRDIIGRENITEIHRALADVHEICLEKLAQEAFRAVASKQTESVKSELMGVEYAIMLTGKLASREPNYHSDISMLILYDSPSQHHGVFFQQVAQKLIQMANRVNRFGRLFELNAWQFLGGKSSGLAWRVDQLLESIQLPEVPIEHRMNLYTARIIGSTPFAAKAELAIEQFLHRQEWTIGQTCELIEWRRSLELSATQENIKRGWGGTLDVEVLAHIFYAKHLHTAKHPWLRGTVERLEALRRNGVLSPQVALQLRDAYYFLRGVESGLRLMNTKLRHDLPRESMELAKLAYVLQSPDREQLMESCEHYRREIDDHAQRCYAQFRAQMVGG